ncbi:MAG TPA: lactonase family protein [Chloroflexota bacterium]|nr:lactonase family protein [Chloroflexota bacterium]
MESGQSGLHEAYVGAYTGFGPNARGNAEGINIFRWNPGDGALNQQGTLAGVENPTFLALHPSGRYLYAVNGSPSIDGHPGGAVSAFAIAPTTGDLTFINRQYTVGQGPSYVTIHRQTGRYLLAAGYHTGNVLVFRIETDGSLGPTTDVVEHHGTSVNPDRQDRPHPHSVNFDLAGRFALVCDLGLDRVFVYRFDANNGKLIPNDPPWATTPPGSGPRHLAVHPSGRFVFVINEIDSTLSSFRYDPEHGVLTTLENVSTIPEGFVGEPYTPDVQVGAAASRPPVVGTNFASDVHVASSGRFVYGSNRGHDSIVIYGFDEATARLSLVGHQSTFGRTPRTFTIDPSGSLMFVPNQGSDNIVSFYVDAATGQLTPTGNVAASPTPTHVVLLD